MLYFVTAYIIYLDKHSEVNMLLDYRATPLSGNKQIAAIAELTVGSAITELSEEMLTLFLKKFQRFVWKYLGHKSVEFEIGHSEVGDTATVLRAVDRHTVSDKRRTYGSLMRNVDNSNVVLHYSKGVFSLIIPNKGFKEGVGVFINSRNFSSHVWYDFTKVVEYVVKHKVMTTELGCYLRARGKTYTLDEIGRELSDTNMMTKSLLQAYNRPSDAFFVAHMSELTRLLEGITDQWKGKIDPEEVEDDYRKSWSLLKVRKITFTKGEPRWDIHLSNVALVHIYGKLVRLYLNLSHNNEALTVNGAKRK